MTSYQERVPVLLDRLAAAQIDLVEWEQHLLYRLGVPLATDGVSNLLFLSVAAFLTCPRVYFF
jgi:hypothetical protein